MKRIFIALVIVAMLVCGLSACHENRLKVLTDSMSPTFQAGDWVTYEEVDASTLKVGDIIAFENADGSTSLHRIVEVVQGEGGDLSFRTKGDAVGVVDEDPVTADQIIGRVTSK